MPPSGPSLLSIYLKMCDFLSKCLLLAVLLGSLIAKFIGSMINFLVLFVVHDLHAFIGLRVIGWADSWRGKLERIYDWGFGLFVVEMKHSETCSEEVRNIISKIALGRN
jgi:hypothetical protein